MGPPGEDGSAYILCSRNAIHPVRLQDEVSACKADGPPVASSGKRQRPEAISHVKVDRSAGPLIVCCEFHQLSQAYHV